MQRVWTSNLPIVRMDVQRAVADDERRKKVRGQEMEKKKMSREMIFGWGRYEYSCK